MSDPWDEFDPSISTRNTLAWAFALGASTLGEAYDMLEQLAISNDIPEVLGQDGTLEEVRAELDDGLELLGPDADLSTLI